VPSIRPVRPQPVRRGGRRGRRVVTDLAGFAAASFHRGTAYVNVATSSWPRWTRPSGGRRGQPAEGKNLVGAFWQPSAVLCDTATLASLPPASGRRPGEVAKYALLGIDTPLGGHPPPTWRPTSRWPLCGRQAAVVASDEREGDRRMLLNYGHTWPMPRGVGLRRRRHRPAPRRGGAVGLVFAALLGRRLGRIDDAAVAHHRSVVGAYDLSTALPPAAIRSSCSDSWVATRRPRATSPSSSTARTASRSSVASTGPTWSLPWRRWRPPAAERHREFGRPGATALGPEPEPAGEREPMSTAGHPGGPRRAATAAATGAGLRIEHLQSNHEGDLVEAVHGARGRTVAIIINAGALSHTSWSLHDALAAYDGVVVELHISNPAAREPFRHTPPSPPCPTAASPVSAPRLPTGRGGVSAARRPVVTVPAGPARTTCPPAPPCPSRAGWIASGRPGGARGRGRHADALLVTTPANIRWLTGFTGRRRPRGKGDGPCSPPTAGTGPSRRAAGRRRRRRGRGPHHRWGRRPARGPGGGGRATTTVGLEAAT